VNNWFLIRDFGKKIREVITNNCIIKFLVDFGDFGKELFKAMNNPLVIILQKITDQGGRQDESDSD